MATIESQWHPGIGDPTVMGWLTVAAYAWVAWSAWQTLHHFRQQAPIGRSANRTVFWASLLALMVALGINKQLDLQTWFTAYFKSLAIQQGWYADRARFQIAFILGMATLSLCGLLAGWRWFAAPFGRGTKVALAGLVLLVTFVLIRASSFHHVDRWLGASWGPMRWNHVLELGALAIIGVGCRNGRMPTLSQRPDVRPM